MKDNTFLTLLKACAVKKDLYEGTRLHLHIRKRGLLEKNPYIATGLISMYAKCGVLGESHKVLEELSIRNIVTWNAVVSVYAQQGQCHEAFNCLERMQNEGFFPNALTFTCILSVCGKARAIDRGKQIHERIIDSGLLEKDIVLGNSLVDMYAKCGLIAKAQQVLEDLPVRDMVSWNILITRYAQGGRGHEALNCFEQIQLEGLSPDAVTFICTLKACASIGAIDKGKLIQADIVHRGLLKEDIMIGTSLIDMYAKCGFLAEAHQVLDELSLSVCNVVSWNALIAGYVRKGQCNAALICFERLKCEGFCPDTGTFISVLKACGSMRFVHKGKEIHNEILNRGLVDKDIILGTALMDMYAKCGVPAEAQELADGFLVHDTITWNALIGGYIQEGKSDEALNYFQRMRNEGFCPNTLTLICGLKACGNSGALQKGKQVHIEVMARVLLEDDFMIVGTALVDMYAKCGVLTKSQEVLEELPGRGVVPWNTLIAGYVQQNKFYDALNCFECMQCEGISLDAATFVCILKACGITGAINKGNQIHNLIVSRGLLNKHFILGNILVDMYAKCGVPEEAQKVLLQLPNQDTASWNAVIVGYANQKKGYEVFKCFAIMQKEGLSPNAVTLICILKSCGSMEGIVDINNQFQNEILSKSLLQEKIMLGNALIDMFGKCGELAKAQNIFEELPVRDVISWNSLIAGYIGRGRCHEALNCLELMQREGLSPSILTLIAIFRVCGSAGDIQKGKLIHSKFISKGLLEKNAAIGNALIDMYVECGVLRKAQQVLEELLVRDVVSWSALISGYTQQGQDLEALKCFERMQSEGLSPDVISFICILKSCGNIGALYKGKQMHNMILSSRLLKNDFMLGNTLVNMYAKCGEFVKSQKVLQELPIRDIVSWNALIGEYAKQGQGHKVLDCFKEIQNDGIAPDIVTFICSLKACSNIGALDKGKQIHEEVVCRGLNDKDVLLGTALIDMYAKCGVPAKAQEVLEELPTRNVISWNALLAGYVQQGQCYEVLYGFEHMQSEGLSPDAVTFMCILKACRSTETMHIGEQIHDRIMSAQLLEGDAVLGTTLVDMYAKCGMLAKAEKVLKGLPDRNTVSWNVLIAGYTKHNQVHEAFGSFKQMQNEGLSPDIITFICILKACGSSRDVEKGKQIHDEIVDRGLIGKDVVLVTALVDMYAKCGALSKAEQVLKEFPFRNIMPWNALIANYVELGQCRKALYCFEYMKSEGGLSPNTITFISILKACSSIGAIQYGKCIHDQMITMNVLEKDSVLGTVLVNMYAKCGMLTQASQVLEELPLRDTVAWNALIAGYALQGQGREALNCFEEMQYEGLTPDEITFLCVLTACCHSGQFHETRTLFWNMTRKYGIIPSLEHHTCMMVSYGCAGQLKRAMASFNMMSSFDFSTLHLLLGVCRKWGNVELGTLAFNEAIHLDNSCAGG